jgi:hypothetical protein
VAAKCVAATLVACYTESCRKILVSRHPPTGAKSGPMRSQQNRPSSPSREMSVATNFKLSFSLLRFCALHRTWISRLAVSQAQGHDYILCMRYASKRHAADAKAKCHKHAGWASRRSFQSTTVRYVILQWRCRVREQDGLIKSTGCYWYLYKFRYLLARYRVI